MSSQHLEKLELSSVHISGILGKVYDQLFHQTCVYMSLVRTSEFLYRFSKSVFSNNNAIHKTLSWDKQGEKH